MKWVLIALFLCLSTTVSADGEPPPWLTMGAWPLCQKHPAECEPYQKNEPYQVVITHELLEQLDATNRGVNKQVTYISDVAHWGSAESWDYPDDGKGDCEDFVLEKRRQLIALGWPRRALLMTVVQARQNDGSWAGHAVLTVRTNRSDLIMDDARGPVLGRELTGYRYQWLQSQRDPTVYQRVDDKTPDDSRCFGGGRYMAMAEGSPC